MRMSAFCFSAILFLCVWIEDKMVKYGNFCIYFQEIIFRYEFLVKRSGKHYFWIFAMASPSLWGPPSLGRSL